MANGLSFEEVERIREKFREAYLSKKLLSAYVNRCGISKIGINDKNAPADQKDNFCIVVELRCPLPSNLSLPSEYQGVRVLVEMIGKIRPLHKK